jgi:acyl-CoA synthetase (AMP-forming)/AMP-acid ligase II
MAPEPYLLHHLLQRQATSKKIALGFGQDAVSYEAFHRFACAYRAALVDCGICAGDRVVTYLPRGLEECFAIFGTSMAGGVFVPANAMLKPAQVDHIIRDSGAKILVTNAAFLSQLQASGAAREDTAVVICDDIKQQESTTACFDNRLGEDLAAILYTSGSTGTPKGVMLSHRNLLAGARIVRTYLGITPDERILSLLPFSFDYGLNQLICTVEQGASIFVKTFRFGDDIVKALVEHEITGLAGVPTIWAILTKASPLFKKTPLPHLRYITNSGGRVPEGTVCALRATIPNTQIFLMYGLTEAFRSTYLPPSEVDNRPTSIGKAIPECKIFIVNDKGERAKIGEPGILVHHGPTAKAASFRSQRTGRRDRLLFRRPRLSG